MNGLFDELPKLQRRMVVDVWTRRVLIAAFAAIAALALLDVFGQRASRSQAHAAAATLALTAPEAVRGGLLFQSRVEVTARSALAHPRLVLDRGWIEGMQVNSIQPDPVGEASRDGRVVLSYDALKTGERLVVWLQFQVNPTNRGRRAYGIELDDAEQRIAVVRRALTVFP